jgi:hypothetical protein
LNRTLLALLVVMGVALWSSLPQATAHGKTCYDKNKDPIPCDAPPVKEKQKRPTPTAPATATAAATATASASPTFTPTLTPTPEPSATPAAKIVAALAPPATPGGTSSTACKPSPLGGPLAGAGLLAVGLVLRIAARPGGQASDAFGYQPSAPQQRLINTAFGQESGGANGRLNTAGPSSAGSPTGNGLIGPLGRASRWLSLAPILAGAGLVGASGLGSVLSAPCGWSLPAGVLGTMVGALLVALVDVRYTLFLPDGTPTRATAHVAMKNHSALVTKNSSRDDGDDSDGDGGDDGHDD